MNKPVKYDEDSIKSLNWKEHIRKRPGMYIGKLGDGSSIDDGIYILIKEVIDIVLMNTLWVMEIELKSKKIII